MHLYIHIFIGICFSWHVFSDDNIAQLHKSAYSDQSLIRLDSRIRLSEIYREKQQYKQAAKWVEDYALPIPENFIWPFAKGYIEAARVCAQSGQAFDAVRRLNILTQKSSGLAKVSSLRALSLIVAEQPDIPKAITFEENALNTGKVFFTRKKISYTAGLEEPKLGFEQWKLIKPKIEERILLLRRLRDVEQFGLDYVLYSEAQTLRRSSHKQALNFTDIGTAFGLKSSQTPLADADFTAARQKYHEIMDLFPEGIYSDASRLYAAVCLVHMGRPQDAIKELEKFYKFNPEGLYRGEALKLLGDIYLMNQWDTRNAQEAYKRTIQWAQSIQEKNRILDTYVVPEKSKTISKPPENLRAMENGTKIRGSSM
ncbi:hypothetical protein P0Y35_18700 [Kiritimatiellaeota bacterium B1221]|nr:hypothetical protein [Kiritimatiellaeota bacterium B1221]